MKKSLFKQGLLTLAVCLLAGTMTSFAEEVRKEYHREMVPVNSTTLTLLNKYGGIVTETWDMKNIVVDVVVTVEHPSKEKAEKILQMIEIVFTEENGDLKAETVFKDDFSGFNWGGDNNRFSINYNVKMPASINLTVSNRYGNTAVDEVAGLANITTKYGNLSVNKLSRGNTKPLNSLVVAYGKATVDELGWAEINARYCGQFTVERATALLVDSRYSKISIGEVSSIVCDSKYDGYNIGKANNMVSTSGYTNINVGSLTKKLEAETRYGGLTVESVPAGFEFIKVKTGYGGVRIGINPSACYYLDGTASYGSIKVDEERFSPDRRIIGNTSTELAGIAGGCGNATSKVTVSASYGSVKLY